MNKHISPRCLFNLTLKKHCHFNSNNFILPIDGNKFNNLFGNTFFTLIKNSDEFSDCSGNSYKLKLGLHVSNNSNKGFIFNNMMNVFQTQISEKCLATINIPNDAIVNTHKLLFKSNKIIIKEVSDISDIFSSNTILINQLVEKYPYLIQYVEKKYQSEELCKFVVKKNGRLLCWIQNQTEEICKLAISDYPYALRYVDRQTNEICKFAIEKNPDTLRYVRNQNEEICKFACEIIYTTLKHIENTSMKQNIHNYLLSKQF